MGNDVEQRKEALKEAVTQMCDDKAPEINTGYTLGWDVVVSYSEEKINERLKSKWQQDGSKIVKDISVVVPFFDEDLGKSIKVARTFQLAAPYIQFSGGATDEPAVALFMPVLGGTRQKLDSKGDRIGDVTKLVENAFVIKLTGIKLGAVAGKYTDIKPGGDRSQINLPITKAREVCRFRQDQSKPTTDNFEVAWVVLSFPTEGAALNVKVENILSPQDEKYEVAQGTASYVYDAAQSYFTNAASKVDVIEYALASVKNKPEFNGAVSVDLTPVSFQFATFSASYQESQSLSLFIHTSSGKDSGEKADLQAKWKAQWINHRITPIPSGYTASLLFNYDLAFRAMLRPGMESSGVWSVDESELDNEKKGGVRFDVRMKEKWRTSGFRYEYDGKVYRCVTEVQAFSTDLKGAPCRIAINQKNDKNGPPKASINWSFTTDNEWTDSTVDKQILNANERMLFGNGNIRTRYELDGTFDLNVKVTDKDLSFQIESGEMPNKWTYKQETIDRTGDWMDRLGKWLADLISSKVPDEIDAQRRKWMTSLKPEVEFSMVGLGFFLTTNLLMPGSKVIELDKSAGIRWPRDLFLVGDVVQGDDPLKT